jgi:lipopolysaccharide/colanic/teichoic acid biosynthesis glycosyltransferase/GT2 family glycosyltransferase
MKADLPLVSVIIPCRNEKAFINKCLDSIVAQDYPKENLEVLAVDGMSDDGTDKINREYSARFPFIKTLENPKRITPSALNRGIKEAKGEIILWMSAHNEYENNYVSKCIEYMEQIKADAAGGVINARPRNNSLIGKSICIAVSHPFGVGNSAHKIGVKDLQWTDTAFGVCYRRGIFEKVGIFNERLIRGQDMEFGLRMKKAGLKTLLVPEAVSHYYTRSDLRSFIKHSFGNGVWAILPFKYADVIPVTFRHLVPLGFVLGLFGSLALSQFFEASRWIFLTIFSCYVLVNICFSLRIAIQKKNARLVFMLPFTFVALHFSYGIGSLWGLFIMPFYGKDRSNALEGVIKRSFDIISSLVGLAILSPLFLGISILIKLENAGPVLYRGVRVGKNGVPFKMFKFRTMVVNADRLGGPSTSEDDPRLTRIGRFLRKYKLDEIPQLINVLKGEMGIVGPRPEVPFYVSMFTEEEKGILTVKPGITDWATLWNSDEGAILKGSHDPEKTYMEKIRPKKLQLQLKYVKEHSLIADLKIIFLTLAAIFKKRKIKI